MKKIFIYSCVLMLFSLFNLAIASCHCSHQTTSNHSHNYHYNHNHSYHSSNHNSSGNVYLVKSENNSFNEKFFNCSKHYMKTNTVTDYYSDGSKRTYVSSTIYNQDGSIVASDCRSVKHIFYKKEHYFIICKNKGTCSIIDSIGNNITEKNYSKIEELKENRFLVRYNKRFGIIDIEENEIVPVKYNKFQKINDNIFITKLNGYYGILDIENNILVKNDCEKIKPLYNTILVKRYSKFGLCNLSGKIIYNIKFDKIKKLGEYILIKKDKKYQVLDDKGNKISSSKFKKVKLQRNTLYGIVDKNWIEITQE